MECSVLFRQSVQRYVIIILLLVVHSMFPVWFCYDLYRVYLSRVSSDLIVPVFSLTHSYTLSRAHPRTHALTHTLTYSPSAGAPFHSHTPAFNVLIRGHKRWFLTPPGTQTVSLLYTSRLPSWRPPDFLLHMISVVVVFCHLFLDLPPTSPFLPLSLPFFIISFIYVTLLLSFMGTSIG